MMMLLLLLTSFNLSTSFIREQTKLSNFLLASLSRSSSYKKSREERWGVSLEDSYEA